MRLNKTLSIDPLHWGEFTQSEFLKEFEGKAPKEELISIYKECKKLVKKK